MLNHYHLQAIVSSISEAVILVNTEGLVILANNRLETLLGLVPGQLIGKPLDEHSLLVLGFQSDTWEALLYQLKTSNQSIRQQDKHYSLPSNRSIKRTQVPVLDDQRQVDSLLMIFTDETELYQLQDEMTSLIVHDLRSPLTAVTASMRLLRDMAEPDDPLGDVVLKTTDISGRAIRKLLVLVNSLLDMSKLHSGMMILDQEPTSIGKLIDGVCLELAPLAAEMEVILQTSVMADLPPADADPEKVERVLYNLVDNAIKFTPEEGIVSVFADQVDDDFIRVAVTDTGQGIPVDLRDRIFDRYQQISGTYARRRGTGLGLTYCKMAVEAHGGRIWIEDRDGGGTVFAFTLPIARLS